MHRLSYRQRDAESESDTMDLGDFIHESLFRTIAIFKNYAAFRGRPARCPRSQSFESDSIHQPFE
jgi:hypothetical protein